MKTIESNILPKLSPLFIYNKKTVETVSEQKHLHVLVGINPDENMIRTNKATVLTVYSVE